MICHSTCGFELSFVLRRLTARHPAAPCLTWQERDPGIIRRARQRTARRRLQWPSWTADTQVILLYSACVPIQAQSTPSSTSVPSARYPSPTRTDQLPPTFLKCSDG